jgi:FKBP-type peptidyl-prolyl cis-trans isomerase SlyD
MQISKDKVVTLNYTLTGEDGTVIETSREKEPLSYIHGGGRLIRGFESALEGRSPKDAFAFTVNPAEGYGERREDLIFQAKREQFASIPEITIGMPLRVQTPEGAMIVRICEVRDDAVLLDANHPLAGQRLSFDVEVLDVRDATEKELEEQRRDNSCSPTSCSDSCCTTCGEGCGG